MPCQKEKFKNFLLRRTSQECSPAPRCRSRRACDSQDYEMNWMLSLKMNIIFKNYYFLFQDMEVVKSDCYPGIEFSVLWSGIQKFVITVSRDPVSGLGLQIGRYFGFYNRLGLISCRMCGRLVGKVCQNGVGTKEWLWLWKCKLQSTARSSTLACIKYFIH